MVELTPGMTPIQVNKREVNLPLFGVSQGRTIMLGGLKFEVHQSAG